MYNRYIPRAGGYERVPMEDAPPVVRRAAGQAAGSPGSSRGWGWGSWTGGTSFSCSSSCSFSPTETIWSRPSRWGFSSSSAWVAGRTAEGHDYGVVCSYRTVPSGRVKRSFSAAWRTSASVERMRMTTMPSLTVSEATNKPLSVETQ